MTNLKNIIINLDSFKILQDITLIPFYLTPIAASKVYEKYPEIIKESVNSEDLDVQE